LTRIKWVMLAQNELRIARGTKVATLL